MSTSGVFVIVTGRGAGSESGEAVLRPAILALFRDEYKELDCAQNPRNPGMLVVGEESLRAWLEEGAIFR